MDIEKEIKDASERIKSKETVMETNITTLTAKIQLYTKWAWGFVGIGIFIAVVGLITYFCARNVNEYGLNLLGDFMAGTVASVWSLAGLFLIYVAFLGQKQQLLNQQLEIMYSQLEVKYTRLELAGQKAEMARQNKTLEQQKFENTFFQLLANHNSIVNSIDLWRNRQTGRELVAQGRDCFVIFCNRFQDKVKRFRLQTDIPKNKILAESIVKLYKEVYDQNISDLSHYFRNMYHIIKFVDESKIDNKKRYTNFVRAQLSAGELLLLFYNCLVEPKKNKFKPLIEKYSLLKHLDDDLMYNLAHKNEYKPNAFR